MKRNPSLLRLVVLAMLVAVGVVISPILRVEGMCPTAHLINIVCAVLLGPVYSFVCACTIGVIRMSLMGIPPLALTGAVFGAALSVILYRLSGGRLIFAVIGEVVGTGIIGAVASYPVMTLWWGYTGLTWVYYVPSFIAGTLIGGSVAFLLLKKMAKNGMLLKMQQDLGAKVFDRPVTVAGDSMGIVFLGIIAYLAVLVLVKNVLKATGAAMAMPWVVLALFVAVAAYYYFSHRKESVNA